MDGELRKAGPRAGEAHRHDASGFFQSSDALLLYDSRIREPWPHTLRLTCPPTAPPSPPRGHRKPSFLLGPSHPLPAPSRSFRGSFRAESVLQLPTLWDPTPPPASLPAHGARAPLLAARLVIILLPFLPAQSPRAQSTLSWGPPTVPTSRRLTARAP